MTLTSDLIRQNQKDQIWSKYCGHFDLSMDEFMQIQERLLFEQFDILKDSAIGKRFFGNRPPRTIQEFRERVPFTTYDDYVDLLLEKDESLLPKTNYRWCHTSGRSGKYDCKWIPYTDRMYERFGEITFSAMILSSATYKGDVRFNLNDVLLLGTAPVPYASGYASRSVNDLVDLRFLPPLEEGEKMEFAERISTGFKMGMDVGVDYFYGLASVLGKMGESFEQGGGASVSSMKGLKFSTILRLLKGFLLAKIQSRPMLPKDIWKLKGVMTAGMDTDVYRKKVEYYWGRAPLEAYASTEGLGLCMQAWNYKGMTLFPDVDFYEFIPFDEHLKSKEDPSYTPKTVLTNELTPGIYEVVFTNLLGGVVMRYRVGDLLEVIALEDKEIGCSLPQFKFYSRGDDLIDLGGIVRFTEKTIWQALNASGLEYTDWTAKKEYDNSKSYLSLYIEFKSPDHLPIEEAIPLVEKAICELNPEYVGLDQILGEHNLSITELPVGAFAKYIKAQKEAGADLAHLKPAHMQPNDQVLKRLINLD